MDTAKVDYVLHYFRQLYRVPDNVKISYGEGESGVVIARQAGDFFNGEKAHPPHPIVWKNWRGSRIPLLFAPDEQGDLYEIDGNQARINYDLIANSFFFLSNWQEYRYFSQHTALRYPYSESLQARLGMAHIPVVNYYLDILKTVVERVYGIQLTPAFWPDYSLALCLTHDVDTCFHGWPQDAYYLLKQGAVRQAGKTALQGLRGKDAWFNLVEIMQLEQEYQAQSSFYLIPRQGSARLPGLSGKETPASEKGRNADYDVQSPRVHSAIQTLREFGFEVGAHGSFFSHQNAKQLLEDCRRLPVPVRGGRFHYLLFQNPVTISVIEETGLVYDSTLGFAETPGFRNGIAFPFVPYHLKENRPARFIEIPLMVMDTSFRSYQKMPLNEVFEQVERLLNEVEQFKGCLTVLWHNNYFTPYKFKGWKEIYQRILKTGQERGAWLTSAEQISQALFPRLSQIWEDFR